MAPLRLAPLLAAALSLPRPAAASSCRETPFAREAAAADVIFVGEARAIDGELATTFDVERVYKGDAPARVLVETGRNKYAALEPPHRYLVLAVHAEAAPGNLFVRTCSGSRRAPWPADIDRRLGPGEPPSEAPPLGEAPPPAPDPPPVDPEPPPATDPRPAPPADARPAADPRPPAAPPPVEPRRGCTVHAAPSLPTLLLLVARRRRRARR
ncbi:MAG: hypothetical protein JNL82_16330 [Myxococcales bacterium]|nr:hypothetical protein [Myxococcales bacterium]